MGREVDCERERILLLIDEMAARVSAQANSVPFALQVSFQRATARAEAVLSLLAELKARILEPEPDAPTVVGA